jgi:hypothetical protein
MGHRREDLQPVVGSGQWIDGVLRVGHEPEDVAGGVAHAGDVVRGAIGVAIVGISQDDLPVCLEALKYVGWRVVAAGRVLHRDREQLTGGAVGGERHRRPHDLDVHLAADEAPADVRQQGAGQQPGLAQHLEAVADAEHEPALL